MISEAAILKPRVLILTTNLCYPLTHGGAIGQYYIIDGLKEKVDFVLCTIVNSKRELDDLKQFMRNQPLVKVYLDKCRKQ